MREPSGRVLAFEFGSWYAQREKAISVIRWVIKIYLWAPVDNRFSTKLLWPSQAKGFKKSFNVIPKWHPWDHGFDTMDNQNTTNRLSKIHRQRSTIFFKIRSDVSKFICPATSLENRKLLVNTFRRISSKFGNTTSDQNNFGFGHG